MVATTWPAHSAMTRTIEVLSFEVDTKKGSVRITVNDDLDQLFDIYDRVAEPRPTAAVFEPRRFAFLDGFWIKGTEVGSGRLMHLQAVGLVDLGDQRLSAYLQSNLDLYRPLELCLEPAACAFDSAGGRTINGLSCYHGELWVLGGRNGYQGTRLAEPLTRFAVHLAHKRFAPDYIWALMAGKKIRTRFYNRIGYARASPKGAIWTNTLGQTELEEFVVWSDQTDLAQLLSREPNRDVLTWLMEDDGRPRVPIPSGRHRPPLSAETFGA